MDHAAQSTFFWWEEWLPIKKIPCDQTSFTSSQIVQNLFLPSFLPQTHRLDYASSFALVRCFLIFSNSSLWPKFRSSSGAKDGYQSPALSLFPESARSARFARCCRGRDPLLRSSFFAWASGARARSAWAAAPSLPRCPNCPTYL